MHGRMVVVLACILGTLAVTAGPAAGERGQWVYTARGSFGGGGINLELAPPELQRCFGETGFLVWDLSDGFVHLNRSSEGRIHVLLDITVEVAVTSLGGEPRLTGQGQISFNGFVEIDPTTHDVFFRTPIEIVVTPNGGEAFSTFWNFGHVVLFEDAGFIGVAFGAVPEYSDISCA
jgi:hypothetical protein